MKHLTLSIFLLLLSTILPLYAAEEIKIIKLEAGEIYYSSDAVKWKRFGKQVNFNTSLYIQSAVNTKAQLEFSNTLIQIKGKAQFRITEEKIEDLVGDVTLAKIAQPTMIEKAKQLFLP